MSLPPTLTTLLGPTRRPLQVAMASDRVQKELELAFQPLMRAHTEVRCLRLCSQHMAPHMRCMRAMHRRH